MTIIQTELIGQFVQSPHDTYQTYCGLDTCLTHEIFHTIKETFSRRRMARGKKLCRMDFGRDTHAGE